MNTKQRETYLRAKRMDKLNKTSHSETVLRFIDDTREKASELKLLRRRGQWPMVSKPVGNPMAVIKKAMAAPMFTMGETVKIDFCDNRFPSGYRHDKEKQPSKGKLGGCCNVTACQIEGKAFFWNYGTRAYYCYHCASDIHQTEMQYEHDFKVMDRSQLLEAKKNHSLLLAPPTPKTPGSWKC